MDVHLIANTTVTETERADNISFGNNIPKSPKWREHRNCTSRNEVCKSDENKNVKHFVTVKIYVRAVNCSLSRHT